MGGLQKGLVTRSQSIHGSHLIIFNEVIADSLSEFKNLLIKEGIPFYSELETEVMLKHKNFIAPAKLHGIELNDKRPLFLKEKDFTGLVMGSELASKIKLVFFGDVQIVAPGVTDNLMGEVPRFISETLTDYLYTELIEVDEFEVWARLAMVQNLVRKDGVNQLRLFGKVSPEVLDKIKKIKTPVPFRVLTWEQMNEALVWSLNLETKVMLFLFISMSFLVAIAITTGLLIFYSKIKKDLMSFWILGMSQQKILNLSFKFTLLLSILTIIAGGVLGHFTLLFLENFGHDLMPDIFLERKLPVFVDARNVLISLGIPFGISMIFSYFSFANFRKENQSFVSVVRSLN